MTRRNISPRAGRRARVALVGPAVLLAMTAVLGGTLATAKTAHAEQVAINRCLNPPTFLYCAPPSGPWIPVGILSSAASGQFGLDAYQSHCTAVAGVSTGFGTITYDVNATGTGTSTGGAVAVGTTVNCVVYDTVAKDPSTGKPHVYGFVGMGEPGPEAVANGLVNVDLSGHPAACTYGASTFSDGNTVPGNSCPPGVP